MAKRLLGIETEFAFSGKTRKGAGPGTREVLERFLNLARNRLAHLPDFSNGIFLASGSRFYIDCGLHPEFCTPECADPWEVVRYVLAGERILAGLAQELVATDPQVLLAAFFKCNVDYTGEGATWGCHESYLHRADPCVLSRQIVPHLVSRLIYTGAGGFNPFSAGLEFMLSPRVPHLLHVTSNQSTSERGIVHTKDEPLCGNGFRRLHLLCGESLCSETAMWLKTGTTALVVAMIEAGLRPGDAVELQAPLEAMRTIASDSECRALVRLAHGQPSSALRIQRHYLAQAESHVCDAFMPPWAEAVCREWRVMLDRIEQAPESLATTLDWTLKRELYAQHAHRCGFPWASLSHWTYVMRKLRDALGLTDYRHKNVTVDFILSANSPISETVKELEAFLHQKGLRWDGLTSFLNLRQKLFEIDMRFGQLDDNGIFAVLDRAGVLAHRFMGIDNIEQAITQPPAAGRARVRGECVRRFAGSNGRYRCDWQGVWDSLDRRVLDLSDPFATEERWRRIPENEDEDVEKRAQICA